MDKPAPCSGIEPVKPSTQQPPPGEEPADVADDGQMTLMEAIVIRKYVERIMPEVIDDEEDCVRTLPSIVEDLCDLYIKAKQMTGPD